MATKTAEELFAEGCSHLRYSHHKYDDTKCYEATTENDFMAKDFFEKAAKQDYAPALRELARCYIEGYGVMFKNKITKGIKYLCQAVLAGDKNALNYCIEREDFFSKLTDSDACTYLKQISDYHDALVAKEEAETEEEAKDIFIEEATEATLDSEDLNPQKYLEQVKTIYKEACNAAIELLKQNGEKQYVIIEKEDSEDKCVETTDGVGPVIIFGVGIGDNNQLVVAAVCDGMYDGYIPREWINPKEYFHTNYADLYRFVVENITKNHTDDEATKIAKEWWGPEPVNPFLDSILNGEEDPVDDSQDEDEEDIVYPAHLIIEDGVERIEENAYSEHEEIESLEMPDSVTYIGDDAFQGCSNLRTIKFSANLETIDTGAFSGCDSLTEIILPEGLSTIEGAVMFSSGSFAMCKSLTKVTLPKSINWIGSWAFEKCENLKSITIKNPDPSTIENNDDPIAEDSLYETCTLIVPNGSIEAYKNHEMFRKFKNIISE